MKIKTTCPMCGKVTEHTITEEQYLAIQQGKMIQSVFPDMNPSEREQFVSGICPECWEKTFPEDE